LSSEPNYHNSSANELFDVLENIDKDLYPERVERIKSEIGRLSNTEIDNSSKSFRFTKNESYCLLFFAGLGLIIFSLFTSEVPISRSNSAYLESNPKLYWFALILWIIITLYAGFKWLIYDKDNDT